MKVYEGDMGWAECSLGALPDLLGAGTHEVTVVHDEYRGPIGLAAPKQEGEVVNPNAVFIDALAAGVIKDSIAGGRHFRTTAELAVEGLVAAYVTRSLQASGAEQGSIMEGDLPPLPVRQSGSSASTLLERIGALVDGRQDLADDPIVITWDTEAEAALAALEYAAGTDASPASTAAAFSPCVDGRPVPPTPAEASPDPNRPVNPCGDCVFAGGIETFSQGNAVVTVEGEAATVTFFDYASDGTVLTSGSATVGLPSNRSHWSDADVTQYTIGRVLDHTRRCNQNGWGTVEIPHGWFGILGTQVGCSGLVAPHPTRNKLVPNRGFTSVENP